MNILFLTTVLPSGIRTGGEIASQSFINALEQNDHQVLVLGYQRPSDVFSKKNQEIVIEERYIETQESKFTPIYWMGLSIFKNLPFSASKYYSQKYVKKIKSLLNHGTYDTVIIDHAQLGWLLPYLSNRVKVIFIAHNVEHQLYLSQWQNAQNNIAKYIYKREACLIENMENNLAKFASEVWTLTPHDCSYFQTINQENRVFDLPSWLIKTDHSSATKAYDIGIIGSWTWKANHDGLKWFFESVYPLLPVSVSIHVAGQGAQWLLGQYPNVKYCGFVPDAQSFMDGAKVIAIPSVSGGGVQIKTLDAIASGSPIVASPLAMRGISDYPSSVEVADNPEDFARSLMQLLRTNATSDLCEDLWMKLRQSRFAWTYNRQERFFADVAYAINSI